MPTDSNRATHWDFMLRDAETLLTWALEIEPSAGITIAARRLPNHDLKYLEYEGNISDNRGRVKRVARGTFCWIEPETGDRFRIGLAFEAQESNWELLVQRRDHEFDEFRFTREGQKSVESKE